MHNVSQVDNLGDYMASSVIIEDPKTHGWAAAIRGMRNSRMNHDQSDSVMNPFIMGEKDLDLATRLCKRSSSERKFLRMIHWTADMTASISFWHDFDMYKVGTVANSESRIAWLSRHNLNADKLGYCFTKFDDEVKNYIEYLNKLLDRWRKECDSNKKRLLYNELVNSLPCGYQQTRTLDLNYEVLRAIYHERYNHPLTEFREFCAYIRTLPYAEELITDGVG